MEMAADGSDKATGPVRRLRELARSRGAACPMTPEAGHPRAAATPGPQPWLPPALAGPRDCGAGGAGAGTEAVPVDVLFLAASGAWRAEAVLGDGGTGRFGTGAVRGRWGLRLQEGQCPGGGRGTARVTPRSLLLTASLTGEFPCSGRGQVINTWSLRPSPLTWQLVGRAGRPPSPPPEPIPSPAFQAAAT